VTVALPDLTAYPAPAEGDTLHEHLIALPGGTWTLWRMVVLRGAGFPALQVLRLAAPASADAADSVLRHEETLRVARAGALHAVHDALDGLRRDGLWADKELRKPLMKAMQALTGGKVPKDDPAPSCAPAFETLRTAWAGLEAARAEMARIYPAEVARVSEEIADIAREDRFREAVLWQNRHAVETALDELAARPAAARARTSKRRQHEELAASYLQRYCTKNDTIGFFGPVAFSRLNDEGEAVSVRCGAGLVQQRAVYFETWCIEALAETLGRNPALRPWLAPRLKSSFHLHDRTLHRPFGKPIALPEAQASLIARCDGRRVAYEVARDLVADPAAPFRTEEEVYRLLEELCKGRVLTWALQVPPDLHPDRRLAELLSRIGPEPLRAEALATVEAMQRARDRVASAAGDPNALDAALRDMESTFRRLTGTTPRQREGQTYAARGLVYEDCRRDIEVAFGPELTRRMGPPLSLVLRSARWLAAELARGAEEKLRALYAQLRRHTGTDAVDAYAFFTSALPAIFFHPGRKETLAAIERDLYARWSRVLGPLPEGERRVRFAVSELEDRFAAEFGDAGPVWTLIHYFSPDVMISAEGEEAFRRGNLELVLGEVHGGNTLLWSCFISQHPASEEVTRFLEREAGSATVVLPQALQHGWPRRVSHGLTLPGGHYFQFADDLPSGPEGLPLPAGDLVIEETAGGVRARTRDGRVSFHPIDLFAAYLTNECTALIGGILEPAPHTPRVSFDDMIIARERWSFTAAELDFAEIQDPQDRFLALRRWAGSLGLPRFCFFKVEIERKPCYLDLDSPISGDLFARFVRAAREAGPEVRVSVSEMAPRLDQAWLRDAAENLYTCELRLAASDRECVFLTP